MNRREAALNAKAAYMRQAQGRREDYEWLRREQRLTVEEAARRVGVCVRQAWRYEAAMKAGRRDPG